MWKTFLVSCLTNTKPHHGAEDQILINRAHFQETIHEVLTFRISVHTIVAPVTHYHHGQLCSDVRTLSLGYAQFNMMNLHQAKLASYDIPTESKIACQSLVPS